MTTPLRATCGAAAGLFACGAFLCWLARHDINVAIRAQRDLINRDAEADKRRHPATAPLDRASDKPYDVPFAQIVRAYHSPATEDH